MKTLVFLLFTTVYCSGINQNVEYKEKRIAGGGNYGGFIGLTYGAGPILVRDKVEKDNDGRVNRNEYQNENNFDSKYVRNVGSDDFIKASNDKGESYNYDPNVEKKEDTDEFRYRGRRGYCIGEYRNRNRYENEDNRENIPYYYNEEEINERCDRMFGFNGPNGNDEPENLVRPCALDDWQCIRKYFAANSECKPAYGPIPDPLYIDVNSVYYPFSNLTLALPNLVIRGLSSATITEFYVNKKSRNLVLAFDVVNLNETIPRVYFRYRRTGKESIVLAEYGTINFRSVTFTAVIPNVPKMRLDLADIHATVQDPAPVHIVGPQAINSTDPDVISAFGQFFAALPVTISETILFQSQLFASIYIQNNICDFGLKLISV